MAWSNVVFRWNGYGHYNLTLPTLADGELGSLQVDQRGRLRVAVESAVAPSAASTVRVIPTASALQSQVIAGAANLLELLFHNESSVALYLMVFDTASAVVNGAVPKQKFRVPADCPMVSVDFGNKPVAYANGIRWAASTTAATLTLASGTPIWLEAVYQ